ncbi:DUF262 domain-containing protein [Sphingomonas sp. CFBP 8760]|uniref:DUF262 domain-containing protein n=1 Tax=Sphingomonas sp. CFBP 8760 TaxID=2775282 RepID=UPI00177F6367|nr:DUF262 domain-containing protein [Sphingomonas sp. CFBP 8760]MBD8548653.1 DUF262 domain-containing protein [Sphingomonas sp. CFBP 8760]
MANDEFLIEHLGDESDEDPAPAGASETRIDPDQFFASSAFRVVYQTNNFFLPQIKDLIDKGEVLNLRPEYQRRLRWTVPQKSRLIESLLLNIPIPPVYLFESDAARYEVMDGQQRLNAVREFMAGGFALSGLEVLKPLNGLRYLRCPPRIKRALDRSTLSAIVLLLESEPSSPGRLSTTDIRRFIFDRLNTGGTKLNAQELRNAIYPGPFNQTLVHLSRFRPFTETFDIPPYIEADPSDYYENEERQKNSLYSTMADCQLVLRYFALKDDANIRGSMKAMLDRAMDARTSISEADARAAEDDFRERYQFLYDLFDQRPFRLPADARGRERVSAALYDASMVAMEVLWDRREEIVEEKNAVHERLEEALADEARMTILTGQGNTAQAVKARIALMVNILQPAE